MSDINPKQYVSETLEIHTSQNTCDAVFFNLTRLSFKVSHTNNTMGRRKNPHPKRAVSARTILKVARDKEEEVEEEEPLVLCSRIPDEEDDLEANQNQIQKEEEEDEGEDDDVEQLRKIMCVPCDDDVVMEQNHQMREEETAFIA